MGFTERENERVRVLDYALRPDGNDEMFVMADDETFYPWYARLLSTLTVLTGEQDIVFASAVGDGESANVVLVTESAVMTAHIQNAEGNEHVPVRVVPINAVTTISVSASMRFDVKGSAKLGWPGNLTVDATFAGVDDPIRFEGNSWERHTEDHVGSISRLLDLLRNKLEV